MAYDDQNIFAKILRGDAPAYAVYETNECLAFLDVMPQSDGHTLVLPKSPATDIFELDDNMAAKLIQAVQHVSRGVRKAFDPDGVKIFQLNGSAAGQTVFHLHVHVVPVFRDRPLRAHTGDMAATEILEQHAEKLRNALAGLGGPE